jgi:hypothetical protein
MLGGDWGAHRVNREHDIEPPRPTLCPGKSAQRKSNIRRSIGSRRPAGTTSNQRRAERRAASVLGRAAIYGVTKMLAVSYGVTLI